MYTISVSIGTILKLIYTFMLTLSNPFYSTPSRAFNTVRYGSFQHRKYMQSYVIKSFLNPGPIVCLQRCAAYSGCNGVNYQPPPNIYCELLRVSARSQLIDRSDFRYSELSSWIIEYDVCWPNPCASHRRCVITNIGLPVCASVQFNLTGLQNVALGKPAYMNSQYDYFAASYGNDGKFDIFFCTGYASNGNDYWYVDLGSSFDIQRVEFINRDDSAQRLHKLNVTIGPTLESMQLCGHFEGPGQIRQHVVVICPVWMVGRYVKLVQPKENTDAFLHLFEVEVYGYEI